MTIKRFSSKAALAQSAANHAADTIRHAISLRGQARIIAATGASQFEFLEALTKMPGIDWDKVEMFHLDEYVGMSDQSPASFCRYLRERLIDKVGLKKYLATLRAEDTAWAMSFSPSSASSPSWRSRGCCQTRPSTRSRSLGCC